MQGSALIWAPTHLNLAHALRKTQYAPYATKFFSDRVLTRIPYRPTAVDTKKRSSSTIGPSSSIPSATAPLPAGAWSFRLLDDGTRR